MYVAATPHRASGEKNSVYRSSLPTYAKLLAIVVVVGAPLLGAVLGVFARRSGFHPSSGYWSLLALVATLTSVFNGRLVRRVGPGWSEPGITRSKLPVMALALLMMFYSFFLVAARLA